MSPERWQQVKELFDAVHELPVGQREAYLSRACEGVVGLRGEVESLIAAYEEAPEFFESPAFEAFSGLVTDHPAESFIGSRIGPYQLTQVIASGGMGTVYLAVRADEQYHKQVAIKVIRSGMVSEEAIRRFRRERQTLASLDHPHIAKLLDGGVTQEGLPYLVMEYVPGQPLDRYGDERRLPTLARLRLFQSVCSAVHYAHQNLVVHRDLKPSNILVTSDGEPKLLDFGIAKVLDSQRLPAPEVTATVQRLMTPSYASPEQIRDEPITTASDVYSLGVVLYELLTGHHPYQSRSRLPHELARTICEEEPVKPSTAVMRVEELPAADGSSVATLTPDSVSLTRDGNPDKLRRRLVGDIDWIVLKALRKDPARRYASVEQLMQDIRRHLEGLPVSARPDTFAYRSAKFVKRHKGATFATLALLLALLGGIVGMTRAAGVAARERDRAVVAQARAEQINLFLQDMLAAARPAREGRDVTVAEVLDKAAEMIGQQNWQHPEVEAAVRATIGNTYAGLGRYDPAETHLRAALHIRRGLFGIQHPDVATTLNDLGSVFYARGDYVEAEALFREALDITRAVFGEKHTEVATILNNLAASLKAQWDLTAAEALYRQALAIRRELLGEEHPDVAQTLNNLGGLLQSRGDFDAAEPICRDVLRLRRKLLGDAHPDVAQSMANLAVVLGAKGEYDQAEPLARKALELSRRLLGDAHPDVAIDLKNLAWIIGAKEGPAVAEPLLRECLAIWTRTLPAGHWRIAAAQGDLARALTFLKRYEDAEPMLLDSHQVMRAALGDAHRQTQTVVQSIIELYEAWGQADRAAPYRALLAPSAGTNEPQESGSQSPAAPSPGP